MVLNNVTGTERLNGLSMAKIIFKQEGIAGFYKGFTVSIGTPITEWMEQLTVLQGLMFPPVPFGGDPMDSCRSSYGISSIECSTASVIIKFHALAVWCSGRLQKMG